MNDLDTDIIDIIAQSENPKEVVRFFRDIANRHGLGTGIYQDYMVGAIIHYTQLSTLENQQMRLDDQDNQRRLIDILTYQVNSIVDNIQRYPATMSLVRTTDNNQKIYPYVDGHVNTLIGGAAELMTVSKRLWSHRNQDFVNLENIPNGVRPDWLLEMNKGKTEIQKELVQQLVKDASDIGKALHSLLSNDDDGDLLRDVCNRIHNPDTLRLWRQSFKTPGSDPDMVIDQLSDMIFEIRTQENIGFERVLNILYDKADNKELTPAQVQQVGEWESADTMRKAYRKRYSSGKEKQARKQLKNG